LVEIKDHFTNEFVSDVYETEDGQDIHRQFLNAKFKYENEKIIRRWPGD
jgi:hypothetical protein